MDKGLEICKGMIVTTIASLFIYRIGIALDSRIVLMTAFGGCTIAMLMGLFVMFVQYWDDRL